MKPLAIQVIPAMPGFYTVVDLNDTKEIILGEPVIAWRIETYDVKDSHSVFSTCIPLTLDGDPASNCIGVQNPDNTVTVYQETTYHSLAELQTHRYAKTESL